MPKAKEATMVQLSAAKLSKKKGMKQLAKPKVSSAKFPSRKLKKAGDVRKKVVDWTKKQKVLKPAKPQTVRFKATKITTRDLDGLRKIHESTVGTAEMIKQKQRPTDIMSKSYSSFLVLEYTKMRSQYIQQYKKARSGAARAAVRKQWAKHIRAVASTFAKAGVKNIKQVDLDRMARTLTGKKGNLKAVTDIYNTGTRVRSATSVRSVSSVGEVVPTIASATLPPDTLTSLGDLCDNPLQARIERSFSCGFAFRVRLWCWCPTWWNPGRWCWRTFTLAGVSFAIGIDIGYRIDCRGFAAWGAAYAEACGTLLGIRFCASCEGRVEAGAALGQSTGDGMCRYGAGASVGISCQFCGLTVFQMGYGVGLLVTAPCI
ncbi:MAG: hypothetical protein GY839_10650 [candidate division Zixibacteria bacterium]|nr:hypothetical protein [candidate division Zixibacteria bacterium]